MRRQFTPKIRRVGKGVFSPFLPRIPVGSDAGAALSGPYRGDRSGMLACGIPLRAGKTKPRRGVGTEPSAPLLPHARVPYAERFQVPEAVMLPATHVMSRRASARASEMAATIASRTPLLAPALQSAAARSAPRGAYEIERVGAERVDRSGRGGWRERAGYSHHGKHPRARSARNETRRVPIITLFVAGPRRSIGEHCSLARVRA